MTHEYPKPFRFKVWHGIVCVTCGELALTQHALHGDLLVLLVHHLLVAPVTHTSISCMDCMYVWVLRTHKHIMYGLYVCMAV